MLSQMENEASYMKNEVVSMMPSMRSSASSQTPGTLSQMENEASYMKNEVGSMMPSMPSMTHLHKQCVTIAVAVEVGSNAFVDYPHKHHCHHKHRFHHKHLDFSKEWKMI